jgi:hypothetical protein
MNRVSNQRQRAGNGADYEFAGNQENVGADAKISNESKLSGGGLLFVDVHQ